MGFHHGLSGLNAASKSLDVSGHNIANSNTIGFKNRVLNLTRWSPAPWARASARAAPGPVSA